MGWQRITTEVYLLFTVTIRETAAVSADLWSLFNAKIYTNWNETRRPRQISSFCFLVINAGGQSKITCMSVSLDSMQNTQLQTWWGNNVDIEQNTIIRMFECHVEQGWTGSTVPPDQFSYKERRTTRPGFSSWQRRIWPLVLPNAKMEYTWVTEPESKHGLLELYQDD